MLTTILRAMWKDWGFAPSLLTQAKQVIGLVKKDESPEACLRASLLFSMMSFEAYFRDAVRGYIETNRATINPAALQKVQKELNGRVGIDYALKNWPALLTGQTLDTTTRTYRDYEDFREYRNLLVHGKISDKTNSGKLAQDFETLKEAESAYRTAADMIKVVAAHFGFQQPTWA